MANHVKAEERDKVRAEARKLLESGEPNPVAKLMEITGINRERARMAVGHMEARLRGEQLRQVGRPSLGGSDGETRMYTLRVPPDLYRFLGDQGPDAVREKLSEWMRSHAQQIP